MNPAKNVPCAHTNFTVSNTSGDGIPVGMVLYTTVRVHRLANGGMRFVRVDRHGEFMTRAEAERYNLERGYTHRYGRNVCGWRMSRAARRRGIKPPDNAGGRSYLRSVESYAKQLAEKLAG